MLQVFVNSAEHDGILQGEHIIEHVQSPVRVGDVECVKPRHLLIVKFVQGNQRHRKVHTDIYMTDVAPALWLKACYPVHVRIERHVFVDGVAMIVQGVFLLAVVTRKYYFLPTYPDIKCIAVS